MLCRHPANGFERGNRQATESGKAAVGQGIERRSRGACCRPNPPQCPGSAFTHRQIGGTNQRREQGIDSRCGLRAETPQTGCCPIRDFPVDLAGEELGQRADIGAVRTTRHLQRLGRPHPHLIVTIAGGTDERQDRRLQWCLRVSERASRLSTRRSIRFGQCNRVACHDIIHDRRSQLVRLSTCATLKSEKVSDPKRCPTPFCSVFRLHNAR